VVLALLIPLGQEAPVAPELPTSSEQKDAAAQRTAEQVRAVPAPPLETSRDERGGEMKRDRTPLSQPAPPPRGRSEKREKGPLPSVAPVPDSAGPAPPPARYREAAVPAAARSSAAPEQGLATVETAPIPERSGRPIPVRCQELPAAAGLEPGLLEVVAGPDRARWEALLGGPARSALERLAPDFRSERVVLIGPGRAPLACATIRVVSRPAGTAIQVPQERELGGPGGLALVIPAGSSAVEIESDAER